MFTTIAANNNIMNQFYYHYLMQIPNVFDV